VLAVEHRLRDSDSFRRTVRSGRRAGGAALVTYLHVASPDGQAGGPAQVGFVVSKAVGGSVVRNRVRRRLRHLVRSHLSSLPAGADLVVRALPPAAQLDSSELGAELARCLERVLRLDSAVAARTGAPS